MKCQSKIRNVPVQLYLGWILLVWMFCGIGCGQPQGEMFEEMASPVVWPQSPETARVKYLGQLSTEADLRRGVSPMESLTQMLFGQEEIGVMVGPYAVAFDGADLLFVADTAGAVIHLMNLNTREYKQFFALAEEEKLVTPVGLCLGENYLYAVDSSLGKICVFDLEGHFQFSWGEGVLIRPSGIAYHRTERTLYIADAAQHAIFIFDATGRLLGQIGSRGVRREQFNFPTHLWIDNTGQLYVSDTLNYRIQIFSARGEFLRMFGQQGDRPGYFAHPCGVATDKHGNIYVVDKQFENVQIFSSAGEILMAFGGEGDAPGQFWLPGGIFIDESNRIYVADQFNKRVQIFQLLESSKK